MCYNVCCDQQNSYLPRHSALHTPSGVSWLQPSIYFNTKNIPKLRFPTCCSREQCSTNVHILTRPVMFNIQHHYNPNSRNQTLHGLVPILLATVTPPIHALPTSSILFTLGAGVLWVGPSLMEFGSPVRSGSWRLGPVYITRYFELVRAVSIQSATVNGRLVCLVSSPSEQEIILVICMVV